MIGELLDSHLFFFDRYSELADFHRMRAQAAKADRLAAFAEAHYQAAPDDESQRPRRWRCRFRGQSEALYLSPFATRL